MFKVLCNTGRSAPKKIPGASEALFSSSSVVGNTVLASKVLSKPKGLLNATHELETRVRGSVWLEYILKQGRILSSSHWLELILRSEEGRVPPGCGALPAVHGDM